MQPIETAVQQYRINSFTCNLAADCGQPKWPGWRWLAIALIAGQIFFVIDGGGTDFRLGRAIRSNVIRILRTQANGGRIHLPGFAPIGGAL